MKKIVKRIAIMTLALVIALVPVAQAATTITPVVDQVTYEQQVGSGSNYTVTASVIIKGGSSRIRYSTKFGVSVAHTAGTTTNYLATKTMSRTQNGTANISGGSYGSTFVSLARNENLTDSVTCSMISTQYYRVDSDYSTGTYDFRVAFPGAMLYENVDQTSSSGTTSLYNRVITYVPSSSNAVVVPYKIT